LIHTHTHTHTHRETDWVYFFVYSIPELNWRPHWLDFQQLPWWFHYTNPANEHVKYLYFMYNKLKTLNTIVHCNKFLKIYVKIYSDIDLNDWMMALLK